MAAFGFFGGVPGPAGPGQPASTGVDRPDLYDPKINRSYAELAAHYGFLVGPGAGFRPAGQAAGRAADAVCAGLVLAGPGVHQPGADAGRGGALVHRGRRAAGVPSAGRRRPGRGVRRRGERCAQAAAGVPVRAGHLGEGEDRPGHPRPGRQGAVLGAVAASSARPPTSASPTSMVQFFIGGAAGQDPRRARPGASRPTSATTRRRRSPSTCAPRPGAARRPGQSARRASRSSPSCWPINALYRLRAAQGVVGLADKHGPSRLEAACAKAITAGDPSYRTIKGILAAGPTATRPRPRRPATAAPARSCTARALFANVVPLPGTITSDELDMPPRAAARKDGHDPPGHGHRPHRPGAGAAAR